jgi:hypothetical protein
MLWLFTQIWLWLLVAFVLGALTAAVVMRTARRRTPPPPAPTEQTQRLPAPPDEYVDPEPWDPEPHDADRGRRSGTLPIDWPPAS